MAEGKVVGGYLVDAMVVIDRKGELTITNTGQIKLDLGYKKSPKLNGDTVARWEEVPSEANGGTAFAIGQAVAGVVLPGAVGKLASGALGGALSPTKLRPHTVRIDWVDGKQSLIQLPEKHFKHLAIQLQDRKAEAASSAPAPAVATPTAQPDVMEQIGRLAALRDQGILTEEEFAKKKTELLARL
jgi:hypothetical protein